MLENRIFRKQWFLLLVFTISFFTSSSQTHINSPYSRYGIGDLQYNNNAIFMSMGGLSYGIRTPSEVNYSNPASYTAFDSLSFVFNGSVQSKFLTMETSSLQEESNYTSIGCLLFGFPVTGWWKSSFGLVPVSSIGYKITDSEHSTGVGNINYFYEATGGINQFYIGNAFKITKSLSFGINAAYLFGSLNNTRSAEFDSSYLFNTRITNSTNVGDVIFTFGLQYHKKLKNDLKVTAGIVANNATNIAARDDVFAITYQKYASGIEYVIDTIEKSTNIKGKIKYPVFVGAGIAFEKENKWLIGADFSWQNWADYSSLNKNDSLGNSMQICIGAQITPSYTSVSNYLKKIQYRLGARYSKTYLELRDNQLDEYGISFGLGFPMKKTKSTINIGLEYGQRGTTDDDLIKESFYRIILGFSLYERWFIKRKFF